MLMLNSIANWPESTFCCEHLSLAGAVKGFFGAMSLICLKRSKGLKIAVWLFALAACSALRSDSSKVHAQNLHLQRADTDSQVRGILHKQCAFHICMITVAYKQLKKLRPVICFSMLFSIKKWLSNHAQQWCPQMVQMGGYVEGICLKQQACIKKKQEWPRSRNLVPGVEASYFLALWNCHVFFSQLRKHGYAWASPWRPLNMLHQCWWLWCGVQFCSWFSYKFVICLFEQNAHMPSTFSYLMRLPIDLARDICWFKSK